MIELETLVEEATELRALPHSAVRLSSLLSHADWVLKDLVHAVEHDPALTGRLLKLANSSVMGGRHPISAVSDAIVRVGPGPLLSLTLASAVRQELQQPLASYGLAERELWKHSVATALAVDRARRFCGAEPPPGSFVAALLHDIGKLVLNRHLEPLGDDEESPTPSQEILAVGANHCLVGGVVADHWNLTENVSYGISQHHDPSGAGDREGCATASFVSLADCVAHHIDGGDAPKLSRFVIDTVQIDRPRFDGLCETTAKALEDILEIYS